ncbi:MAG: ABC transporter ATP-binding protein [Thermoprotei archaeon]|nr:MAG: ABC transporter ATP-binding protein [Thermoprotei archaeon]RLF17850.1 MAG: ABC transporter ATP-binding protein [Thermoprotei archaeon]
MPKTTAIDVLNLVKRYTTYERIGFFRKRKKVIEALKGISFKVMEGEVFGLLGPNGAGKTTTVKIISTLLLPDEGTAKVLGYDVVEEANEVRKLIGVSLSVEKGFFWKLTGRENLKYFGMLYGLDGELLRKRIDELIKMLGLDELNAADKLYEEYSLGMKARLSLARALLTDPPVLILDEPTLGLDPPSARSLRELLVELAHDNNKTVLITTHNMFEAEIICDKVAIIDKGVILAVDTVEGLKKRVAKDVALEISFVMPAKAHMSSLLDMLKNALKCPCNISHNENVYRLRLVINVNSVDEITSMALKILHEMKCKVRRVDVKEPTLEDVFIKLTGRRGFK